MNLIIIEGKLGATSEIKYTPGGTPVLEFSVAISESYKDKEGNWQKITEWFSCRWWGQQAESNADHLKKGTPVIVQGKQRTDKWEDKNGGGRRERKYVLCSSVKHFTTFKKDHAQNNVGQSQQSNNSNVDFTSDDIPF